jgi:flagellar biosynthesis/type III secretory pathway M-ring protein FliF/YscJ
MNFFGDKRFLYAIVAVFVVIIVVAAVFWSRNQTTESQAPATTSSPTATPASPSTTVPKQ